MKRKIWVLWLALLLTGCSTRVDAMDAALQLRSEVNKAQGYQFDATIEVDYGDQTYTFGLNCASAPDGSMRFAVTSPESIRGISGTIYGDGGTILFNDVALAFPVLPDGQLSPVSAPWIFMKTLQSGFMRSAGQDGELLRVIIDDNYEDNAFSAHIWLNSDNLPVCGEIYWQGRRILHITVENFQIL